MSKVALVRCLTPDDAATAVPALMDLLGDQSWTTGLRKGSRVLIKPNICVAKPPSTGATTHPQIVEAVVRRLLDQGFHPVLGEGPAVGVVGDFFGLTGLKKIARKFDIPLINLNTDEPVKVKVPAPLVLGDIALARSAVDADAIINLPVIKTHLITMYTGALKNLKGVMVALEKHKPHKLGVAEGIVDVNQVVKPVLHIMDGIVGMEGDGPAGGSPVNMGVLLASCDPVALDAAALHLIGIPVKHVKTVVLAEKMGLGTTRVQWVGDAPGPLKKLFRLPCTAWFLKAAGSAAVLKAGSRWVLNIMEALSKVNIRAEACQSCGACREMCPYQAIYMTEHGYRIDGGKCRKCLCCHEVCRHGAIRPTGMLGRKSRY